jgi:hypothetical protein
MTEKKLFAAAGPDGYPSETMPRTSSIVPDYAIVCEVEYKLDGNRLVFQYKGLGKCAVTTADPIAAIVKRLATSPWRPPGFGAKTPDKRRSSLSLNNKKKAYIIFVLDASLAWQFSREAPCFTLFADPEGILKQHYSAPTAVDRQGNLIGPIAGASGARVAYFVADGEKSHNAQLPRNADRFNIHVDLNEDAVAYIPIVIDPDVGHPGGAEP